MRYRKSRFVHQIPVGADRVLVVHAVSQVRLTIDTNVSGILDYFATARNCPECYIELSALTGADAAALESCIASLVERGLLTQADAESELDETAAKLTSTYGRDPLELLDAYRQSRKEGAQQYWTATTAQGIGDLQGARQRVDVVLFGDCDIQMEADFLRREAARRGIDLRVAATFPDDFRFVSEHKHDAIIIGALRARHTLTLPSSGTDQAAHAGYSAEASHIIEKLRERSAAPILIDNLPEPTVQPLGLAERGLNGHRTRFRVTNVMLANLVDSFADVHVVDIAAALAATGTEALIDDGLVGFTHLGSPGWLLQRPPEEKAAVHGIFPDPAPLAHSVGGDPYRREGIVARAHVDALTVALAIDRKKCVIVDLDGTLWPGVLAETGSPFAFDPAISGAFSYVGLYFGLHEALLCLKQRGIVLACVSKNDEATVRELWKYNGRYPTARLLTPDDFVTWRVNWTDKVENIRSIADELGFALDTFVFIDDHPIERDRVRIMLPQVEVWGEDPFALRRWLLNDPRLQLPRLTKEAAARTELTKAQLNRQQLRNETTDESAYRASLQIETRIGRAADPADLARIAELFQRTTQFNATGRKFAASELKALSQDANARVYAIEVSDRFGDQGLVGAAVVIGNEIAGLVMSCRVLGLGVEHEFMRAVIGDLRANHASLSARIIETARNTPVRNIYRDHGFTRDAEGVWQLSLSTDATRAVA